MASITLCPRCSSHLELPIGASPTSQIECPICEAEFLLASVAPRVVPKARVLDDAKPSSFSTLLDSKSESPAAPAQEAEEAEAADAMEESANTMPREGLSHLLRSTPWQLSGVGSGESDDVTAEFASDESDEDDRGSLDAAYQDAVPPSAPATSAADKLQLEGSRLDQLLSDLMKTPKPSDLLKQAELAAAQPAAAPSFDEVDESPASPAVASTADEVAEDDRYEEQEYDDIETVPPHAANRVDIVAEDDSQGPVSAEWSEFEQSPVAYADEEEEGEFHDDEQFDQDLNLPTPVRQRRRPSLVRSLVGIVGGGVLGILGGGYFLLWYNGPEGDLLGLSKVLPASWLPASSSTSAEPGAPAASDPWSKYAEGARDAAAKLPPPAPLGGEPAIERPVLAETHDATPATDEQVAMHRDAAVAPATAESPVAPPAAETPVAQPPAPADSAAATGAVAAAPPSWPTTPIVGSLRGVTLFTMEDLDESLVGADAAHRQFLAGDLSRKEDVAAMGKAFIELCGLAERFTLTDPAEFGNELITKQMAAKQIFRGMVGDPARRNDLAMIAGRWLQHERRQNQGIILLGRVTELHAQGPWTEYTVEIPLGDSVAAAKVLMEGVKFPIGSPIAVVGAIVANPRQAIADYSGDAPQVVVAGFAFPPEDFAVSDDSDSGDLFTIKP